MTDTTLLTVTPADATLVTVHVDNTIVAEPGPDRTTVTLTAPIGPRGPQGDTGEQGPVGLSAYEVAVMDGFVGTEEQWLDSLVGPQGTSGGSYHHVQNSTSNTWVIVHNLGYEPGGVQVFDSGGTQVIGDVTHDSANQLTVTFSSAFSGVANLS